MQQISKTRDPTEFIR